MAVRLFGCRLRALSTREALVYMGDTWDRMLHLQRCSTELWVFPGVEHHCWDLRSPYWRLGSALRPEPSYEGC